MGLTRTVRKHREYNRRYRLKHREKLLAKSRKERQTKKWKAYQKLYKQKHRRKLSRMGRMYYERHGRRWKNTRIMKVYGVTLEFVESLSKSQDYRCKICRRKVPLVIDHNHKTDKFRGLICATCNRWLAPLEKRGWVLKARRYLRDGSKRVS